MGTTTAISQQCTTKPPTPLCTTTPGHTPTTRSIGRTPWFTRLQFTNTTPTLSTTNCHQLAYGLISKPFETRVYSVVLSFKSKIQFYVSYCACTTTTRMFHMNSGCLKTLLEIQDAAAAL